MKVIIPVREIKFRALNVKTNEWIYFDLKYLWHCCKKWLKIDWTTVQQFTGLKDKNDKEMYEGDIVRGFRWIVVFSEKRARFVLAEDLTKNSRALDLTTYDVTEEGELKASELEVMGNIYENENKDLIK